MNTIQADNDLSIGLSQGALWLRIWQAPLLRFRLSS